MNSLEKKMFYLPNRFYVKRNKLFVYFNLAVIPADMNVICAVLHLPLPNILTPARIIIKEIATKWSEKSLIQNIVPDYINYKWLKHSPGQDELITDITPLLIKWSIKSKTNNGLYVKLKLINKKKENFVKEKPPYLVVETT